MNPILKVYAVSVIVGLGMLGAFGALQSVLADSASTAVSVQNAAPSVTSVDLTPSPITLTENTSTTVTITATVTDSNGCDDVFTSGTITAVVYRSGLAATSSCSADENNCYRNITLIEAANTCTGGADTSGDASGTIPIWYFAEATDASSTFPTETWQAAVTARDATGDSGTSTDSTPPELNSLYALNVTSAINFGAVSPGTDTGSTNQPATTTNTGNFKIDIEFSGTDMTSGGNTLNATQEKYGTSSVAYSSLAYTLSTSATARDVNLTKTTASGSPVSTTTYWGIAIPNGQATGTYSGTNTFTAIYSSN